MVGPNYQPTFRKSLAADQRRSTQMGLGLGDGLGKESGKLFSGLLEEGGGGY